MYTLWLMPDEAAYQKLSRLIVDLSTTHDTPTFEPHVTLLSGIIDKETIAIQKAEELANSLIPVSATLTRIEFLEVYYRCLFFCTNQSEDLMEARTLAEEIFEHTQINPFIPHVSFLYGSLPIFQKEAIIGALGDSFFMDFRMPKLRLVETRRTPEHWRLMAEFDL
ncbi:haloacid dehalogenase [Aureispira anguillae]|uniref:Haloacid dehalogenase n=1 Tax=Aureispira anguillae TaxID=2864201 RepID=A0A915YFW4_9BACT|nr:haloacid dehalogenase [Aureispira anguillae]BDS12274.1 haloacid dehalogenase [Aureispira anguillae]